MSAGGRAGGRCPVQFWHGQGRRSLAEGEHPHGGQQPRTNPSATQGGAPSHSWEAAVGWRAPANRLGAASPRRLGAGEGGAVLAQKSRLARRFLYRPPTIAARWMQCVGRCFSKIFRVAAASVRSPSLDDTKTAREEPRRRRTPGQRGRRRASSLPPRVRGLKAYASRACAAHLRGPPGVHPCVQARAARRGQGAARSPSNAPPGGARSSDSRRLAAWACLNRELTLATGATHAKSSQRTPLLVVRPVLRDDLLQCRPHQPPPACHQHLLGLATARTFRHDVSVSYVHMLETGDRRVEARG